MSDRGNYQVEGAKEAFAQFMGRVDRRERVLIYFTVGGQPGYAELWARCLESVRRNLPGDRFKVEILVISDRAGLEALERVERVVCDVCWMRVPDFEDGEAASRTKLRVFDWQRIDEFDRVLFLDADVLATRPLDDELLTLPLQAGVLYAAPGSAGHGLMDPYHGLGHRDPLEARALAAKGVRAFNTGVFMFLNTPAMRRHFANVQTLMNLWPHRAFYEQAYMNAYFLAIGAANTSLLSQRVRLCYPSETRPRDLGHTLVHFAGKPGDGAGKIQRMNQFTGSKPAPTL